MFENIGLESSWGCKRMRGAAVEADAIREQQPTRTRSGAAAEVDTSGERGAAAEAGVQQQLKRMQSVGKQTQSGSSSSAQRAVRRRITHGRRMNGEVAERVKRAKLLVQVIIDKSDDPYI